MSLVAFKARNHPQQGVHDEIDDRRTPWVFFDKLNSERQFTIDAAASTANAMLAAFWTIADDGLWQSWEGHRVWCNPPYSNIAPWVEKAWRAMLLEGCISIDMLLPANRTEQRWWQQHVEPFRDGRLDRTSAPTQAFGIERRVRLTTEFGAGRLRFEHADGPIRSSKNSGPPFGIVLLTWQRVA